MASPKRVRDEAFLNKIRGLPCMTCGHPAPSDPCHVTTRRLLGDAKNNVFPACRACHHLQHLIGIRSFAERFKLPITNDIRPVLQFEWDL